MTSNDKPQIYQGKTLSPGLGEGKTFIHRDVLNRLDEFYDIEDSQVEEERNRFARAAKQVSVDLNDLVTRVKDEMDDSFSAVFEAHLMMLQDHDLKTEVEKEICNELVSAGSAVKVVFRRWERRFRSMEAQVARQKGDDIRDLARRLLYSLAGIHAHALEGMPDGSVLVANRLLPSDTIFLGRRKASAAVLEVGGAGSHAALFAHEIGLPCVSGLVGVVDSIPSGVPVLVDADSGEVIFNPDQERKKLFSMKHEQREQVNKKAMVHAHEPASTRDGRTIRVLANIGGIDDTRDAMANGAEGIGLFRIERTYLGRQNPPNTAALMEEIRNVLEPARELPVYVRLLDIGADKPLPYLETYREINPSLGLRGVRFLQRYPNLLHTQLQAMLRLSGDFDLHVLVPMVTLASDMEWVKQQLTEQAALAGVKEVPKLGAMIETPAAALAVTEIAQFAEFMSFGTNDLTQYTFAADRENAAVDAYFDDTHEVIFKLIRGVRKELPNMPLSVCGELASRPQCAEKLVACGIDSLSVASPSIPFIKQSIRHSTCNQRSGKS